MEDNEHISRKHKRDQKNAQTLNELRQVKTYGYEVPTHDPQTGELNPEYEEVTGTNNPWDVYSDVKYITKSYKEDILYKLKDLRKQYPNNQEFGEEVIKYFEL